MTLYMYLVFTTYNSVYLNRIYGNACYRHVTGVKPHPSIIIIRQACSTPVTDLDIHTLNHRHVESLPQAFCCIVNTLCDRQINVLLQSCMAGLPQDSHMFVNSNTGMLQD